MCPQLASPPPVCGVCHEGPGVHRRPMDRDQPGEAKAPRLNRRTLRRVERAVRRPFSPNHARLLLAVATLAAVPAVAAWMTPVGYAGCAVVAAVTGWGVGGHWRQQRAVRLLGDRPARLSRTERLEVAVRIVEHPLRLTARFDTSVALRLVADAWTVNDRCLNNSSAFVLTEAVQHRHDTTGVDLRRLAALVHNKRFDHLRSCINEHDRRDPYLVAVATLALWDRLEAATVEVAGIYERLVADGQHPPAALAAAELLAGELPAEAHTDAPTPV